MVKVAILGHGVVGSGVAELLLANKELLTKRVGKSVELKSILDLSVPADIAYKEKFTNNFDDVINDPEVTVVAELIGGVGVAYEFTKDCLEAGKHVVTANKELVAEKGAELLALAKENNVKYLFEGSVGGGIPVIRPLYQDLVANNIESISGILNGTCNYILTKMKEEGRKFEEVLAEAQELGYAEADPSADVDGHDTCRKICILASIAFGEHVYPVNVHTEGIRNITIDDITLAEKAGFAIKLIGATYKADDGIHVTTSPMLVSKATVLGNVNNEFNAVEYVGDFVGEVVHYGRGAGKLPTASAVVSDIAECISRPEVKSVSWKSSTENNVANYLLNKTAMLVRYEGSFENAEEMFGFGEIIKVADEQKEVAFLTPFYLTEVQLDEKLRLLELESGGKVISRFRVLGESHRWKIK